MPEARLCRAPKVISWEDAPAEKKPPPPTTHRRQDRRHLGQIRILTVEGGDRLSAGGDHRFRALKQLYDHCSNGLDNDNDGLVDQTDPHCRSPADNSEHAACADHLDNDGDGFIDQGDAECDNLEDDDERS